jgi:hypothetical protein
MLFHLLVVRLLVTIYTAEATAIVAIAPAANGIGSFRMNSQKGVYLYSHGTHLHEADRTD